VWNGWKKGKKQIYHSNNCRSLSKISIYVRNDTKKGYSTVRVVFVVDLYGIIKAIIYYLPEVGKNLQKYILAYALQVVEKGESCITSKLVCR